ncbi:ParB/RepB/Spo0J family partition protein [Amylibacter sp. SFDW26]|uniref:ParB/RepB/Spo0J family partition protein n=1 Tax=Amylibacter sp. SFDW26 TaxID=2652722 RepID=UPI001261E9EA|nr:ParB/RepB/Spo0J family partition protein [Amylibacter sp. SFDW26]KAB7609832.1 ParB/RepB/Spo0J family partition protein [Amylibacter sp. SFDW26]
MAKRKRLTAPDAEALKELETGFAAKPQAGLGLETKSMAPIAKVAGEAAAMSAVADQGDRVDAAQLRAAKQSGLLAQEIPVAKINVDYVSRDRVVQDPEAMAELKSSIESNGLRTPIEVVETKDGYGLISGWRRLAAMRDLSIDTIKAFVREAKDSTEVYLNMVEENEIRADLSHYERGRIAVVAAGQGVYADVAQAVDHLFASASKAKRSKVRSFAVIHEALGDLLQFPADLTEKAGLSLAKTLRDGDLKPFRAALAENTPNDAAEEWRLLEGVISKAKPVVPSASKGGRPAKTVKLPAAPLKKGGELSAEVIEKGFRIELKGRAVMRDDVARIQRDILRYLDRD